MNKLLLVCSLFCLLAKADDSFAQATGTEYIVTVTVAGSGEVVSSPPGIQCGAAGGDCSATFGAQTPVTLTAKEDAQFVFQGWSAATGAAAECPGATGPCSFVLNSDTAITATFVPSTQTQGIGLLLSPPVPQLRR
jgi:hypothetical protein